MPVSLNSEVVCRMTTWAVLCQFRIIWIYNAPAHLVRYATDFGEIDIFAFLKPHTAMDRTLLGELPEHDAPRRDLFAPFRLGHIFQMDVLDEDSPDVLQSTVLQYRGKFELHPYETRDDHEPCEELRPQRSKHFVKKLFSSIQTGRRAVLVHSMKHNLVLRYEITAKWRTDPLDSRPKHVDLRSADLAAMRRIV